MSARATETASRRVLVADLEGGARRAIAQLLTTLDFVELVGEVGSSEEIAAAVDDGNADVLVIDDRLMSGARAPRPAAIEVIVVGVDDDPAYRERARRIGAVAWIAKERAADELPAVLAGAAAANSQRAFGDAPKPDRRMASTPIA